jgi:hypothetical protein
MRTVTRRSDVDAKGSEGSRPSRRNEHPGRIKKSRAKGSRAFGRLGPLALLLDPAHSMVIGGSSSLPGSANPRDGLNFDVYIPG